MSGSLNGYRFFYVGKVTISRFHECSHFHLSLQSAFLSLQTTYRDN
jgi:hypothetical protein